MLVIKINSKLSLLFKNVLCVYLDRETAHPACPGAAIANRFILHKVSCVQAVFSSAASCSHSSCTMLNQVGPSSSTVKC